MVSTRADLPLKSLSKEKLEAKKPYNFDINSKCSSLSEKEQPNTTGKIQNLYGFRASSLEAGFPLNGTLFKVQLNGKF